MQDENSFYDYINTDIAEWNVRVLHSPPTHYSNSLKTYLDEVSIALKISNKKSNLDTKNTMTTKNPKYVNVQINLIDELAALTIYNKNFDGSNWCIRDAEILEGAAKMIREDIGVKKRNKEKLNKKRQLMMINK